MAHKVTCKKNIYIYLICAGEFFPQKYYLRICQIMYKIDDVFDGLNLKILLKVHKFSYKI